MRVLGRGGFFDTGGLTDLMGYRRALGKFVESGSVPTVKAVVPTVPTGTDAIFTYPAGIAIGDVCFIVVTLDDGLVSPDPTGYTSVGFAVVNPEFFVFSRVYDGTEPASVACSTGAQTGKISGIMVVVTNADYATFQGTVMNSAYAKSYFQFTLETLTPLYDGLIVVVGGLDDVAITEHVDQTVDGYLYTAEGYHAGTGTLNNTSSTAAWSRAYVTGDTLATVNIDHGGTNDSPAAFYFWIGS